MLIITSGLPIEYSQGDPRNLPEGAAVRLEPRHGPHALDRCDKEFRQRARIGLPSKFAAALPPTQRLGENGFDLYMSFLQQRANLIVISRTLHVRAEQQAAARVLFPRLRDQPQ